MDAMPTPTPSQPTQPAQQAAQLEGGDPKLLLTQATQLVEAAVLRTGTSPRARADEIHAIKTAYQKARYGAGDYNHDANRTVG